MIRDCHFRSRLSHCLICLSCLLILIGGHNQVKAQKLRRQVNITRMGIPYGNYSGITRINDSLYAVVSDKDDVDGFHFFHIGFNLNNGKIKKVSRSEPSEYERNVARVAQAKRQQRDMEGIAFFAPNHSFFISGEADQSVLEYSFEGLPTGRELAVPAEFSLSNIQQNRGFESLTYNATTHLFWTTTEEPLRSDMNDSVTFLRIQSFNDSLLPSKQFIYEMDRPQRDKSSRIFVKGVPDMIAMDDGSLIVMEREILVTRKYLGSYCIIKLYRVGPNVDTTPLTKKLICKFKTKLVIGKLNLANYEGMCVGPTLNDGRQTILLINDSQNGQGNKIYRLKDYLKVIVL